MTCSAGPPPAILSTHQFEAIKRENPALSQKLLPYFVTVMAERLTFAQPHHRRAAAIGAPYSSLRA